MNNIFQNIAVQDVNEAFAYITHWISYLNRGTCQELFPFASSRDDVSPNAETRESYQLLLLSNLHRTTYANKRPRYTDFLPTRALS